MGKIRSTLDIVMERTRDLTITEEQKAELRFQEWTLKARGWVQRYSSGALRADDLRAELARGMAVCPELAEILKRALVQALDPDGDYRTQAAGLKTVLGIDPQLYLARLEAFATAMNADEHTARELRLSTLHDRGIGGSAVLPNLETDQAWQDHKAGLRADLTRELMAL